MTKAQLRQVYIQKRSALSEAEYANLNNLLYVNFFATLDLSKVNTLHIFLPIKKNKEPDTWLIIHRIKNDFPKINIAVPRIKGKTTGLENVLLENHHQLIESNWGIPEPKSGRLVQPADIDMVVVPLLIVDKTGHRVGYGKGFYDRFLAQCKKTCTKVGISYFAPIDKINDTDKNDIALDITIGATGIYDHKGYRK